MTMKEEPLTREEAAKIGAVKTGPQVLEEAFANAAAVQQRAGEIEDEGLEPKEDESAPLPSWALPLPANVELPKGRQIYCMRFRGKLTDTPKKGDRYCILWSLNEPDEKLAYQRTRGNAGMSMNELSKQMIRVMGFVRDEQGDGEVPDWGEGGMRLMEFWNGIGARFRTQVKSAYGKMHTLEPGEIIDFFTNCVAVRTVGG